MKTAITIRELEKALSPFQKKNKKIGLVPTMGALHKGHLSLVELSLKENDCTVVSIFVNPTQFGANEDFNKYPRPMEKDEEILKDNNVEILFTPTSEIIYPDGPEKATTISSKIFVFIIVKSRFVVGLMYLYFVFFYLPVALTRCFPFPQR